MFYLVGTLLLTVAGLMLIPLAVDLAHGHEDWWAFAVGSAVSFILGAILARWCRCELQSGLDLRQAFLLTPVSWLSVAAVGTIPFYFSEFGIVSGSLTNAFFESMSGLTTTGSTVITKLHEAPPGLLIWRAQLQWIGGIGIIAVAIAVLPALGIGGMQLFRTESSDRSEKAMPRVRQIAKGIGLVYVSLTIAAGLSYWAAGMTLFEATAHALTTISTGGYSTSDNSLGNWNAGIQWISALFMLSGGVPFVLYVRFLAGERHALWDHQVKTLLGFLAVVIAGLTAWLALSGQYALPDAARFATFNTISIVTTTGYATTDFQLWGNIAIGLFFGLMFVGGCTGSTAGGIKIFRFEVMASLLRVHFLRLLYPNGVFPRTYAGKRLSDDVIGSVVVFFAIFFTCYSALTIALMAMNLDFATSASGAVTAIANVGPGIGEIIGPAGNFSTLPDPAKWLLSFAMLLGRLELFTVLVLFMPRFWKG
ncbi:TrkH family potassium uptake protein [Sphingomonas sp.]|uniref:TrkH family potassium uptake protein n=1 Tax=Sphingomonas sp. TaxID=28214 RepID=UPI0025FE82A4|nr:TrkH family potassium uptake protein [Sphingomonas sp.]